MKTEESWGCTIEAEIHLEHISPLNINHGWSVISDTFDEGLNKRKVIVRTEIDVTAEGIDEAKGYAMDDCKAGDVCCPVSNGEEFFLTVTSIKPHKEPA